MGEVARIPKSWGQGVGGAGMASDRRVWCGGVVGQGAGPGGCLPMLTGLLAPSRALLPSIRYRVEDLVALGGKGTLKKDLSALRDSFIETAAQAASERLLLAERCGALGTRPSSAPHRRPSIRSHAWLRVPRSS
jgi:hypothetical protein